MKTFKIAISGQVQGVGFRPYVYGLAIEFSLRGTVSNNEEGVIIFVTGSEDAVNSFYNKLLQFPPPVSRIKNSSIDQTKAREFEDFVIIPSSKNKQLNLPLTPDFAICEDCKKDIQQPDNRRYTYPFTSCINCGPRWAITETFPFERNHTSIDDFPMCDACISEYTSPTDRRFHSQTNTCITCGIALVLKTHKSKIIDITNRRLFKKIAGLLADGNIIAIKNTTGYLLCCNAENETVVKKLRTKKNRFNKPFAILYPSLDLLSKELNIDKHHIKCLTSTESPISIVSAENYNGNIALSTVAPGLNQLGVMLPYSGILQLLACELNFPIVATSGNIHGSPIISDSKDAIEKLKSVADYFLEHNLKIIHSQDDSVVKFSSRFKKEVLLRRSRGYAPNFFNSGLDSDEKIMAMGSHLKSTITFYPNEYLYISQYLGNLDSLDVYNRFTETAKSFVHIFEQQPQVILVDKHPAYQSSLYGKELAKNLNAKLIGIQHHKAHFAAILGEHHLFDKKVLGVVFDGTGYGDDGAIWGGEFFKYQFGSMERIGHVTYFDWLLGDKMSKEPRLSLLSLSNPEMDELLVEKFSQNELKMYQSLKRNNKLKTSSVGRLFDAVASLLNITDFNTYEGEAAILLENIVTSYNLSLCKSYVKFPKNGFSAIEIIKNIYADHKNGETDEYCVVNFLFTLAFSIIEIAKYNNYEYIALSGGVFQNTILVDILMELTPKEIKLHFHLNLSPNDENISFGQIIHYLKINK